MREEAQIRLVDVRRVSFKDVVGKKDVGNLVLRHIVLHVLEEIARVYHVNFSKTKEKVARERIAETVFHDEQAALRGSRGAHHGETLVTSHESAVSSGVSITVVLEKCPIVWLSFGSDAIVFVHLIVGVGGRVGHAFRNVVDKVLGCVLDSHVFGISIHATHIVAYHFSVVV